MGSGVGSGVAEGTGTSSGQGDVAKSVAITLWLPEDVILAEKSCVAWLQKRTETEATTETGFIIDAILREVARQRRKHAKELGGKDFPPTMKIRKGRPPGS